MSYCIGPCILLGYIVVAVTVIERSTQPIPANQKVDTHIRLCVCVWFFDEFDLFQARASHTFTRTHIYSFAWNVTQVSVVYSM